MFVPEGFAQEDGNALADLIERYSFALLVSWVDEAPFGTHVPFLVERDGRGGPTRLLAHMARANPHWRSFDGDTPAMAVFQGPHAYISPAWYPAENAVPTWNYAVAHVHGRPRLIDDPGSTRDILERLVAKHEGGGEAAWSMRSLSPDFLDGMQKGVAAFELPVERIEGKFKLNQNQPEDNRRGAIAGLRNRRQGDDVEIAALMDEALKPR